MMKLYKLVASFFGIGYISKGGGTVAAIVVCVIWLSIPAGDLTNHWQICITALVCITGVWSANQVDAIWGEDSSKVVIDEVAGMMITLLFLPISIKYVLAGLVLFRFFDIVKPLFIKKMELFPKGWGVMADDFLAGLYAHILLKLLIDCKVF